MINCIHLQNFKCFKDSGDIEIKPLTVLCGINSSGKSTIIKSLLTLKQTFDFAGDKKHLILNSTYVKNGNASDIVFNHNTKEVSISYGMSINKNVQNDNKSKSEIISFKNISKLYPSCTKIKKIVLKQKNTFSNQNQQLFLSKQENILQIIYNNGETIDTSILLCKTVFGKWNIVINKFPNNDQITEQIELKRASCYFDNFRIYSIFVEETKPHIDAVIYIVNNICLISRCFGSLFQTQHYITPLRLYPEKTYLSDTNDGINFDENIAKQIRNIQNNKYKNTAFLPPVVQNSEIEQAFSQTLKYYINEWLHYLGLGEYSIDETVSDILHLNIDDDNIINVGFGISQVLPILFKGLSINRSDTLLLEQPEIHLHPKAQMAMGDFLISMALNKKGVIVETHSDHIINRIVKRVMDGTIKQEDVVIYFLEKDNGESKIAPIQIDLVKGIVDAPKEFFTQFASEVNDIFNIGLKNLRSKKEL